ncbi:MAG: hypothetical protein K8T20_05665, partial [Planctomycetes bacterium]|nr:hypothetical protein [Planctomycetota bacterium]
KGHWWGGPDPGSDCLSYSEMSDWMQRRRRADNPASWEFRTFSPSVSSSCRGFEILAQKKPYALSRVKAWEEGETGDRFYETENAVHVRIKAPAAFTLDGQALKPGEYHRGAGGKWEPGAPAGLHKSPQLQGPFTQAFHKPFLLVTPSLGEAAETQDCVARARFDAEVWWLRGNGRARVVADSEVTAKDWKDFDLILYGNADSNACWKKIADRLPFRVSAGEVKIGDEVIKGDLALAAVYPNPEVPSKLVAVVGATTAAGRRAWHALNWWHNDTGAPDLLCWGPDIHEKWADAFRAVGHYGADWKPAEGMWMVKK